MLNDGAAFAGSRHGPGRWTRSHVVFTASFCRTWLCKRTTPCANCERKSGNSICKPPPYWYFLEQVPKLQALSWHLLHNLGNSMRMNVAQTVTRPHFLHLWAVYCRASHVKNQILKLQACHCCTSISPPPTYQPRAPPCSHKSTQGCDAFIWALAHWQTCLLHSLA